MTPIAVWSVFAIWAVVDFAYHRDTQTLEESYGMFRDRWEVGKNRQGQMKLCDTYIKDGCLDGVLKGLITVTNWSADKNSDDIYVYFELHMSHVGRYIGSAGISYRLFWPYDYRKASSKENTPRFGILSWERAYIFAPQEIPHLSQELQDIFYDLEKRPRVIINDKQVS